jgi:transcriptional regulator with XRE-family HTH domain
MALSCSAGFIVRARGAAIMPSGGSPQIGPYIHQLRRRQGLTLDGLAKISGVSKSMLSQIERGQTNPTLATVWALAEALKVDVSELIGFRQPEKRVRIDVASASFTPEIRTEDGRCLLRILSPADRADSLEWYELTFAPGGALISSPHARGTREHLTVLEGSLDVIAASERQTVPLGATARYPADVEHEIRNDGPGDAKALLVVTS